MANTEIGPPDDSPGPSDCVIAEEYKGRLVIYEQSDAGWESRIEIELLNDDGTECQWAFINIWDAR